MHTTRGSERILWFKRRGWIYRPLQVMGGVVALLALASLVNAFVAPDVRARAVSEVPYHFYAYAKPILPGVMGIAVRSSEEHGGGK